MKIDSDFLKLVFMHYFRFKKGCITCDECMRKDVIADTGKEILEVEVKVNKYDLLNLEMKKAKKHFKLKNGRKSKYGDFRPNKFYFGVPSSMKELAMEAIKKLDNPKYGIIVFDENKWHRLSNYRKKEQYIQFGDYVNISKPAKKLHKNYDDKFRWQIAKRTSASIISKQIKLLKI